MNSRNGATTIWTSYNLPSLIDQSGGNSSSFSYGADRQRYKQVNVNGSTTETTIYVAGLLERVTVGTVTDYKHYVQGATGVAAIHIRSTTGTNSTYYPLKDHLGSTDRITSSAGSVVVALSYDAFGKRRGSNWTGNPSPPDLINIGSTTRHGFTFHEHLDNLTLVHMNGRVYDPTIGRFTSSDPYVTEPFNTQGFNRYSYVLNNPLTLIDPSGFGPDRPVPPPWGTPCLSCEPGQRRPPSAPVPPTPPPRPGAPINAIPPNGVPGDFMSSAPTGAGIEATCDFGACTDDGGRDLVSELLWAVLGVLPKSEDISKIPERIRKFLPPKDYPDPNKPGCSRTCQGRVAEGTAKCLQHCRGIAERVICQELWRQYNTECVWHCGGM